MRNNMIVENVKDGPSVSVRRGCGLYGDADGPDQTARRKPTVPRSGPAQPPRVKWGFGERFRYRFPATLASFSEQKGFSAVEDVERERKGKPKCPLGSSQASNPANLKIVPLTA